MATEKRTQQQRRTDTIRALLAAARQCFADKGYAATGTPEIVAAAGMTRGALYHHFPDKAALFAAVVEEEHALLAMAINAATGSADEPGPVRALVETGEAFLTAMHHAGRRQILLIDAPAVLGREALDAISARHGLRTLVSGIAHAVEKQSIRDLPELPLAHLLNAMLERAALANADELPAYRKTIRALIRGLKT